MTSTLFVADHLLTRPLVQHLRSVSPIDISLSPRFDSTGFALIEPGHIPDLPGHTIDSECGLSLRDCGTVQFLSPIRPDELDAPTIRLQTESITTELLARATLPSYFGFTGARWANSDGSGWDALVVDGSAGLAPTESAFCEDVVRAWFVLTGLPVVTHVLAVPDGFDPADRDAIVAAIHECFTASLEEAIIALTTAGAEEERVRDLFDNLATVLGAEERLSVPELFRRAQLGPRFGPFRWLT